MTFADLKRKPVVSLSDGVKRGEVDDLIVDLGRSLVLGLVVSGKPLPLDRIRGFGPDALTVENEDAFAASLDQGTTLQGLKELTVVDASGAIVGHIEELTFDASGTLQAFEVHKGGVLGIGAHVTRVPTASIRGVGPKILTVELPAES